LVYKELLVSFIIKNNDKDTGFNNSVQTYELVPGNEMFGLDVTKNLDGSSDFLLLDFQEHSLDK
jgi:hypothetical protein